MESVTIFKRGERVFLEYEIDEKFLKDDEIYYTLKNPVNGTYLKGCAFKATELIPANNLKVNEEESNG